MLIGKLEANQKCGKRHRMIVESVLGNKEEAAEWKKKKKM